MTATWNIRNYHKKSVEEVEVFIKSPGSEMVTTKTGYRWGEWLITTDSDAPPEFNWQEGRVNLLDSPGDDIIDVELVDMSDGCWYECELQGFTEADEDAMTAWLEAHSTYELLDLEYAEWRQLDTDCWIWGPIEITNSQGYRQLVTASEADVQVNYQASEEES
jgi:hypothetical protein